MAEGVALTDDDRWPWLDAIGATMHEHALRRRGAVIACSALKETYRQRLRRGAGTEARTRIVYLKGDAATIAPRLASRGGHFMPASLLASQFAALEEPGDAIAVDIRQPVDAQVATDRRRAAVDVRFTRMSDPPKRGRRPGPATEVAHLGRSPGRHLGAINTPVYRASTILFDSVADYEAAQRGESRGLMYGLHGLPTVTDLQQAFATLEGGYAGLAVPSGLAATTLPLLALTSAGDHILVTDSVYGPTRRFCDKHLSRFGVEVGYYDPLAGSGIESAIRPNTRLIFAESPGSLSFEVQDIRAIATVAHAHGALLLLDNTWATPLHFRAFDHGVDVAVHAGTKYLGGHSDVLIGLIVGSEADVSAPASPVDRHRRHRQQRRLLSGAARAANAGGAPRPAPVERTAHRSLASRPARGRRSRLSGFAGGARPRALETRLHRRMRALRCRAAAGPEGSRRCDAGRYALVQTRRQLGRLREPGPAGQQCHAQRDTLGAARSVSEAACGAGGS